MKTPLALLLLLCGHAALAAVPVTGPITYSQNFNTLPSTAAANWTDNLTLAGWWLHRDGTGPPAASIQISNGNAVTWVANLYSLGATGNTERALGSAPTTAHGAYHFILIFQNTSASPVKVSNVKYDVEVYRTNTTTALTETTQFSRRIAATQAEITSALGTGWTADTTLDYIYPGQTAGGQTRPPDVATVNRAPGTDILVLPDQHVALRWSNPNDGGSDAYMGIDNVEIQFTSASCTLGATTSGVTRNQSGTPGNPNDDTFSFNITVTGFGTGAQGWTSTTGPLVTGAYGASTAVTGVPIASSPLAFRVADVATPTCATAVTVTAPGIDLFLTTEESRVLSFTDAPLAAQSHVRAVTSTEPGFAGGTATANVQFQPAPNNRAKYFDINNAKPLFTTEAVNISNVAEFVVGIDLAAYTTSDTTFEADDALTVTVQTATVATGPWTNVAPPILSAPDGVALFNQIKVSDPGTGYAAGSFPTADFPFVRFRSGAIQRAAGVTYARLSTTGGNNSASEHLLFDNITFASPRCTIVVNPTVTRTNFGDDNLANDTFTGRATVKGELNQGSTGWVSNSTPAAGLYDPNNAAVFGPFPVASGPVTVTFTDNVDPTCSTTITFTPPPTVLITDIINMARNERGTLTLNDDTISFTLTMSAQFGGTGWTSNIPVPGSPGTFYNGNYLDIYNIVAAISSLPDVPLIMDKADPSATIPVATSIPAPRRYVMGDFFTLGAAPTLISSIEYPQQPFRIPNSWKNPKNGVLTLNDASDPNEVFDYTSVESELVFDETSGPPIGRVDVTAELVVSETSPTSNFETNDTFRAILLWQAQGLNYSQNMIDPLDSNGDESLNGYTDTAAAPYNSNPLLDEFNGPAPRLPVSGLINRTIQLTGTIPADAELAIFSVEGHNDSPSEFYRLQNVRFIEQGANPSSDDDGDGVTNANEDIMGTDKSDPNSVLRLVPTPGNPAQFTFTGIGTRFYRVYVSDDTAGNTHLTKWMDANLGTMQDFGPHTVDVTEIPGVARRFFRVHVMQSDGPWPPVVP